MTLFPIMKADRDKLYAGLTPGSPGAAALQTGSNVPPPPLPGNPTGPVQGT